MRKLEGWKGGRDGDQRILEKHVIMREDVLKSIFKKLNTSTGISLEGIALQLRTVLKIQTPWNERNFVRI